VRVLFNRYSPDVEPKLDTSAPKTIWVAIGSAFLIGLTVGIALTVIIFRRFEWASLLMAAPGAFCGALNVEYRMIRRKHWPTYATCLALLLISPLGRTYAVAWICSWAIAAMVMYLYHFSVKIRG
jgi:hypothetical protein